MVIFHAVVGVMPSVMESLRDLLLDHGLQRLGSIGHDLDRFVVSERSCLEGSTSGRDIPALRLEHINDLAVLIYE